jgi:hypothetical protein
MEANPRPARKFGRWGTEVIPSIVRTVEWLPRSLRCEPRNTRLSGRDDNVRKCGTSLKAGHYNGEDGGVGGFVVRIASKPAL